MGSLFAAALSEAGAQVTLLLRNSTALSRWQQRPWLEISAPEQPTRRCELSVSLNADPAPIERLLVCTKANDASAAVAEVSHRLGPGDLILLLSNGMGAGEEIAEQCPDPALALGTTTEGAYRNGTFSIHHAGRGLTRLGAPGQARAPDWFDLWGDLALDCRWEPDIQHALWRKLAINCAINPLTAIHGCRNGSLNREPLTAEVSRLCAEIAAVLVARAMSDLAQDLHDEVRGVIGATAGNRSSMLQDIEAGRPTEIEYITGFLVSQAERMNVPVPANRSLLNAVRQLERRR